MRIAICDDDSREVSSLIKMVEQYRQQEQIELFYRAFTSPLELLEMLQKDEHFDLILLDILMPGENGIEAAREIRQMDRDVKLVFLTASPEFAVESYAVGAYYYQLKPVKREELFELLNQVRTEIQREAESSILVRGSSGIVRIRVSRLKYCEVIGKKLLFYLSDGSVTESIGSMKKIRDILEGYEFIQVHRSFLVNPAYIKGIVNGAVIVEADQRIPIPHGKSKAIKETFLKYACDKKWHEL